jgi:hypothetical protein
MYFMSGDNFQVDQPSRLPCSYNAVMVKGCTRARETIDQAHIYKIGNLNEIGGGVRIEVHKLYEAVFLKRENTVSGFCEREWEKRKKKPSRQLHDHKVNYFSTPSGTHESFVRATWNVPLKM